MFAPAAAPRVETPGSGVRAGRRFAAVLDVENVAITDRGRVTKTEMEGLLAAIDENVAGMAVRVATGINVLRPFMDLLGSRPWGLTVVKTEPDAADHTLIAAALEFVQSGVTDLVIVGGDHAFAPLAAHARLHVVTHADHLARTLRLAATTVTYLPDLGHTGLVAS